MAKLLDKLTDELGQLVSDEDLTDEKLREASESLLPALCDALTSEGYGTVYYKIWSNEHQGWWKPQHQGYTPDRKLAGIYPEAEARQIIESANIGLKDIPNEAMVELVAEEPYAV
mgnify:CR=1 FL=1